MPLLLQMSLSRSGPFAMGSLVVFIYGIGLFGSTYLVPIFMQTSLHSTSSQAGAVLLPADLVLAATDPDRWGRIWSAPSAWATGCRR